MQLSTIALVVIQSNIFRLLSGSTLGRASLVAGVQSISRLRLIAPTSVEHGRRKWSKPPNEQVSIFSNVLIRLTQSSVRFQWRSLFSLVNCPEPCLTVSWKPLLDCPVYYHCEHSLFWIEKFDYSFFYYQMASNARRAHKKPVSAMEYDLFRRPLLGSRSFLKFM